jgi:hypothetical protein
LSTRIRAQMIWNNKNKINCHFQEKVPQKITDLPLMKMVWPLIFILHHHHHHHRYMMCPWTIRSLRREMGGRHFHSTCLNPRVISYPDKKRKKKNPIIKFLFYFFPWLCVCLDVKCLLMMCTWRGTTTTNNYRKRGWPRVLCYKFFHRPQRGKHTRATPVGPRSLHPKKI